MTMQISRVIKGRICACARSLLWLTGVTLKAGNVLLGISPMLLFLPILAQLHPLFLISITLSQLHLPCPHTAFRIRIFYLSFSISYVFPKSFFVASSPSQNPLSHIHTRKCSHTPSDPSIFLLFPLHFLVTDSYHFYLVYLRQIASPAIPGSSHSFNPFSVLISIQLFMHILL